MKTPRDTVQHWRDARKNTCNDLTAHVKQEGYVFWTASLAPVGVP